MCTVSVFRPTPKKIVITMNRDEARSREKELPPRLFEGEGIMAPLDTQAGGTWVAVTRDGLWTCLLNGYLEAEATHSKTTSSPSRGTIIPKLLSASNPFAELERYDFKSYASFRLWVGDQTKIKEAFWDGQTLTLKDMSPSPWAFVTSSSYRQDLVKSYRQERFSAFLEEGAPFDKQGLPVLHTEFEKGREDFAIRMSRALSVTKSITQIIIDGTDIAMHHWYADHLNEAPTSLCFPETHLHLRGHA